MTFLPEDINDAVRELAGGATNGMVENRFKRNGLGAGPTREVMETAKRIINRRARIRNFLIAVAGMVVLAGGAYWYYQCAIHRNHWVRIPGFVTTVGLLITVYGIYNTTQVEIP